MFGFKDRGKDDRKKSDDDTEQLRVAPGTEITYKQSLISKYIDEHAHLLSLFNEALRAYQLGQDAELLSHLRNLHIALRKHLLDEELNLYIYLRHCYRGDSSKQELITRFKKSSKKAGMTSFGFIKHLTEEGAAIGRDEEFLNRFLDIGNTLETLMDAEEAHLYPIYRIPAHSAELPL